MHRNAELLLSFYAALGRRDSGAMNACYASDVEFHDPVFQSLRGEDAKRMWRMLCARERPERGGEQHRSRRL